MTILLYALGCIAIPAIPLVVFWLQTRQFSKEIDPIKEKDAQNKN